ncbi:IclR family transcriptional regulator [Bacillus sp. 1P02SD]|uniref:IclR family transcriptional regulator n=1 Tax=Bacillus sp. 1P02SD TaxID=3132264 RepID=UPI0039A17FA9
MVEKGNPKDAIKEKNERYTISSVENALDLLEAFLENESLSLIELEKLLNRPKSSLFRIIATLEKRAYITRNSRDGKYCLGFKPLELTKKILHDNALRKCAMDDIIWLAEKYGDTVNLGVMTEDDVLYVEIIEGTHSLRMNESVGSRVPFHSTAIGKAIASSLPANELERLIEVKGFPKITANTIRSKDVFLEEVSKIKNLGYAVDNEESVLGARCIAAPIYNFYGEVEGAVSLSGVIHRFPEGNLKLIANDVVSVAKKISKKLGYIDSKKQSLEK